MVALVAAQALSMGELLLEVWALQVKVIRAVTPPLPVPLAAVEPVLLVQMVQEIIMKLLGPLAVLALRRLFQVHQ